MNDKLFKPHGLYCMIMTFKPDQQSSGEPMDITQNILKATTPARSGFQGQIDKLHTSSGKTRGEMELPESAELIFPAIDAMPEGQKANAIKKSGNFISDYNDRRAQAKYVCSSAPF